MPLFFDINGKIIRSYDFLYFDKTINPPGFRRVEVDIYKLHRPPPTNPDCNYAMDINGVAVYCSAVPSSEQIYEAWETVALPQLNTRAT